MVVWQRMIDSLRSNGSNDLSFHVNLFNRGLDEARTSKRGADWLRAMPQFQPSRARLEQQRCEDKEVFAAHQRNLDHPLPAPHSRRVARGCLAPESAAKHDDTRAVLLPRSD